MRNLWLPVLAVAALGLPACGGQIAGNTATGSSAAAITGDDLARLALDNLGGTACGGNSLGQSSFFSSCTGNGGQPEYWCADFVRWVWAEKGFDTSELTAAAGSFYVYGQNHGTLSNSPSPGAAVVFDYGGGGYADHVAIVTRVNADGSIETASGDWNGQSGSEAYFSSTSSVVLNAPAYGSAVGSTPGIIGMTISGFIRPDGVGGSAPPPGGGTDCSVRADGKLYCPNTPGSAIYAAPTAQSAVVNHLRSNPSWFDCWQKGDLHAGGNTTWYHTVGDDNPNAGFVPAVDLSTPDSLDANPSAAGLAQCGAGAPPPAPPASTPPSTPPPAPPPSDPSCSVHADGKLYCTNAAGAQMYASPSFGSGVVNVLRSTSSWFQCWGTGDPHSGGNSTWYYTLGDDNGNWGWVPGVDLNTPDSFDANPSAAGLAHCN